MKREIKFRVWLKPIHWDDEDNEGLMTHHDLPLGGWDRWWLNLDNSCGLDGEFTLDMIEIMQYTGLKDAKGKEIYEGDIVLLSGYGKYKCEFPFVELYQASMEGDIQNIVGNIYENPELLE